MAYPTNTLQTRVVTPQGAVIDEPASSVVLWTALGQIEVLYGHAPTVVLLEPGEMRISASAGPDRVFAAGEGFARIDQQSVTVFTDMAEDAAHIDLNDAEDAKHRAEAALAEAARLSEDERRAADLVVRECLVKIQLTLRRNRKL